MLIVTKNLWIDTTETSIPNYFFIKLGDVVLSNLGDDKIGLVLKIVKVINGVDFTTWELMVLTNTGIKTRTIWLDDR